MKILFVKLFKWFATNSDLLIDLKQLFATVVFAAAWLTPIIELFNKYGLQTDYGLFAVLGQFVIYIARYLYPDWFPKQEKIGVVTWILRFVGNNILAFTFGIFCTPIVAQYVGEQNLSIVAISACVGGFYELVLKRIIKYAYKLSKTTKDEPKNPETYQDGEPRPGDPRG